MEPTSADDEARILARIRHALRDGGDPTERRSALREVDRLFAAHADRVYGLCLRWLGEPERAREAAQDTLLVAWDKLPEFEGDARFSTWLYRIARYRCLNAMRRRQDLLTADGVLDEADPTRPILVRLRRREKEELLREAAAAALDATEQEAVYLRYVEQLPLDRIERVLGIEMDSGARGLLQRCKRKLGRELRRRLQEMGHGSSFVRETW